MSDSFGTAPFGRGTRKPVVPSWHMQLSLPDAVDADTIVVCHISTVSSEARHAMCLSVVHSLRWAVCISWLATVGACVACARYWRERATLNGGRLSFEAHTARLKERHQVQAELQAWCEEALDGHRGQQQRQDVNGQPTSTGHAYAGVRR